MKKLLKIVAWVAGALVVAVVAAAIIAPMVINPNDYRDKITALVHKETGRTLTIQGDLKLSVFPWLGLQVGEMQLGNAAGFGTEPFARIREAQLRVKLLPLLHSKVEMDTVVLDGLRLNLARDARGRTNWSDLTGGGAKGPQGGAGKAPQGGSKAAGAVPALAIGGLRIRDAQLVWDDRQGGNHDTIEHLNLSSDAVALGKPFGLQMGFDFAANRPALKGRVSLKSSITADPSAKRYRLGNLLLTVNADGKTLPGGKAEAELKLKELLAQLSDQTLALSGLQLKSQGLEVDGTMQGSRILDAPRFQGKLQSNEFVPRELLQQLAVKLPPMADPSALTKARFALSFDATPKQAAVKQLDVAFDDSRLTGSLAAEDFVRPTLRWDLKLDKIDVDRYLPPPKQGPAGKSKTKAATPASAAAAGAVQLPTPFLRSLDADGTVKVGSLKASNLHSTDVHATLRAKGGVLHLHPVGAKLYNGAYNGDLTLDVRGKEPRIAMNEALSGVQAAPLLKDFMGKAPISGAANLSAKLTAVGLDPARVRRTLNGTAAFRFSDGAVNGVNVAQLIREAYARLKGLPPPPKAEEKTDFTELSGSAKVTNGLVRNDDLSAKSPLLRVNGQGSANLVNENIDYLLKVSLVKSLVGQGGKGIDELKDVTIPLGIHGTFSQPTFRVELDDILKSKAKAAIKKKENKLKEKLRNNLKDQLKGLFR